MCDAYIRVANVIIHTETLELVSRAALSLFLRVARRKKTFNTFFAIHSYSNEATFIQQSTICERTNGPKALTHEMCSKFYYISAAVIYIYKRCRLFKETRLERERRYKRIYLAQIVHKLRYRTIISGEKWFLMKEKKEKKT
jgi:hypothetical protein